MIEPSDNPILICSPSAPPLNSGAGTNAHNFGLHLIKYGFKVNHFSFNWNMSFPSVSNDSGLKIIRAPYFKYNPLTRAVSALFTVPVMLYCTLFARTIFIYGPMKGYLFLILFGKLTGKKVVFRSTMLGDDDIVSLIHKYPYFKSFRKWALSKLGMYYALNPGFTAAYLRTFDSKEKVFESPQGLDLERFKPVDENEKIQLRAELGLPGNLPVLVSVGYLIKRKGYSELFESLSKLNRDFRYVVIGDHTVGPEHNLFSKKAEMQALYDNGKQLLGDKLIFTGPLPDVTKYLQAADIFLLNSEKEGVPNVLLESMACGCVPVIKEIEGLNGFITFPGTNAIVYTDIEALNPHLDKLLSDDALRFKLAEKSLDFVTENLDFRKVTTRIMNKLGVQIHQLEHDQ